MYTSLSFSYLRQQNTTRCNATYHHLETWGPTDWACAMAGEAGEACNVIKKLRRLDDGPDKSYNADVDRDALIQQAGDELADLVIYADLLAARLGIDLGAAVVRKFNIVSDRVGSPFKLVL